MFDFIDDIVENVRSIMANPYNHNSDDVFWIVKNHPEVLFRCYGKEPEDYDRWMDDPFYKDYADDGESRNSFKLAEVWNQVFSSQTS